MKAKTTKSDSGTNKQKKKKFPGRGVYGPGRKMRNVRRRRYNGNMSGNERALSKLPSPNSTSQGIANKQLGTKTKHGQQTRGKPEDEKQNNNVKVLRTNKSDGQQAGLSFARVLN